MNKIKTLETAMTKNDGNDAILKHTPPPATRTNRETTVKKWISLDISEACGDSGAMSKSAEMQNQKEKVTASDFAASDLESIISCILLETAKDIQRGGSWTVTPEVRAAEIDIDKDFFDVLTGAKSIDDFRAACRRWKDAGTREIG